MCWPTTSKARSWPRSRKSCERNFLVGLLSADILPMQFVPLMQLTIPFRQHLHSLAWTCSWPCFPHGRSGISWMPMLYCSLARQAGHCSLKIYNSAWAASALQTTTPGQPEQAIGLLDVCQWILLGPCVSASELCSWMTATTQPACAAITQASSVFMF